MRKTLFLALLAAALIPVKAPALAVPAGKAAVIEALIGKVSLSSAGKDQKPKVGLALAFGDVLNTGANGRVSLRHADNAVTRLAPNTELTLRAPGAKKGVFLALKTGVIRFLVGKRAPGETFEVTTANAVAAVKGTDAEVETDGKSTRSSVFESAREKALEMLDSLSGKSEMLSPGQSSELDEKGFNTHDITDEERRESEQNYEGLPNPELTGEGGQQEGHGETPPASGTETAGQGQGDAKSDDAMIADIEDAVAQVMDDLATDKFLERDDRSGDLVAGRVVFDRNGDRTQVSAYITRPDDHSVVKANYSRRDTGPFKGTTSAEEKTVWSAPLPQNWYDAVKMPINDPSNLDANGYPILYRVSQLFVAKNPQLDVLKIQTAYDAPRYLAYYDGNGYTTYASLDIDPVQGFVRNVYTNNSLVFVHELYQSYTMDYLVPTRQLSYGGAYYYSSWNTTQSLTADNGIRLDLATFGPTFLSMEFRVLDDDGKVHDLSAMPSGLVQGDFRGLDNNLNLEVTFDAPNFSAPIDLMFIPSVFDSMDILDLPYPYYGGS